MSAVPLGVPFVVTGDAGPLRNDFEGWVGMAIEVGDAPIRVTQLGRIVAPNNLRIHVVKIVDVAGGEIDLGAVSIQMPAGPSGEFAYIESGSSGRPARVPSLPRRQSRGSGRRLLARSADDGDHDASGPGLVGSV